MTTHDKRRWRRANPARTQPIRNWSSLFGAPSSGPTSGRPKAGAAGVAGAVARGVELGYRVIDEYMQQGQQAARGAWAPPGGREGAPPPPADPQRLMERMLQYASDMASVWFEMMSLATAGAAPARKDAAAPKPGAAGPFSAGAAAPASEAAQGPAAAAGAAPTQVSVEVASRRAVEVSVDLRPGSAGMDLALHALRAAGAAGGAGAAAKKKPRLTDVALRTVAGQDRVVVRIRIPDRHPAGLYSGVIVDRATSLPRGSVSVRIPAR